MTAFDHGSLFGHSIAGTLRGYLGTRPNLNDLMTAPRGKLSGNPHGGQVAPPVPLRRLSSSRSELYGARVEVLARLSAKET